MASPIQAQEPEPGGTESWTGGNGWCVEGVCFRAWAGPQGVEVRWLVEAGSATALVVMRTQLQPAMGAYPTPVAQSDRPGEFTYLDNQVVPGALYRYELVRPGGSTPLGPPLEAGLAAQAVDPGGSGSCRVYLPLTLSQR